MKMAGVPFQTAQQLLVVWMKLADVIEQNVKLFPGNQTYWKITFQTLEGGKHNAYCEVSQISQMYVDYNYSVGGSEYVDVPMITVSEVMICSDGIAYWHNDVKDFSASDLVIENLLTCLSTGYSADGKYQYIKNRPVAIPKFAKPA